MSNHTLVVAAYSEDDGATYHVECPGDTLDCAFTEECDRAWCVLDNDADVLKWEEWSEPLVRHGMEHSRYEGGWYVPAVGCAAKLFDYGGELADIANEQGTGRWPFSLEWDGDGWGFYLQPGGEPLVGDNTPTIDPTALTLPGL